MPPPSREAILAYVASAPGNVGKREIARHFGLRGPEREELKALLADMVDDGLLDFGAGRSLRRAGVPPRVGVVQIGTVAGRRIEGRVEGWEDAAPAPLVRIEPGPPGRGAPLAVGDRVLARITEDERGGYRGTVIKRLRRGTTTLLGVVRPDPRGGFRLQPVNRRERRDWPLDRKAEVQAGELLLVDVRGQGARATAHVVERLGDPFATRSLSLIAIAEKNIPDHFPEEVLAEAADVASRPLGPREDWTDLPFVTIDPPDARDHDDAVWAAPDGAGHRLVVAIADVSHYVRPGSPLDLGAFDRGNSIYFPDRVVPMLPHALSSDACSLRAGAVRAVLAADMRIGGNGALRSFSFHRAAVRVVENLAYEEAQSLADRAAGPQWDGVLAPLWACWKALAAARARRHPLALDIPEKRVLLDEAGGVKAIIVRERLAAHQLIEDMMIAANVAAALALERRQAPVMFRNHEPPDREKLVALKDYLGTLGLSLALGQVITPGTFNRLLAAAAGRPDLPLIAEAVLRAQTQAYYGPKNSGHFGLALGSYAHFTSPIRRYADVLVHRALVRQFELGDGGLPPGAEQRFAVIGEHISFTERRAMAAERETLDRYIARHLAAHVGEMVRGRVTGVQAFGLFVTVDPVGGDGLLPVSALGAERFRFDEAGRFLEGSESGVRYHLGQGLDLRLEEADPATGALRFSLPGAAAPAPRFRRERGQRETPRPAPRRGGPPPGIRRSAR
jgi:ribonuclease R